MSQRHNYLSPNDVSLIESIYTQYSPPNDKEIEIEIQFGEYSIPPEWINPKRTIHDNDKDDIDIFLNGCCVLQSHYTVSSTNLYRRFTSWLDKNTTHKPTSNDFISLMILRGHQHKNIRGNMMFQGLKLKPPRPVRALRYPAYSRLINLFDSWMAKGQITQKTITDITDCNDIDNNRKSIDNNSGIITWMNKMPLNNYRPIDNREYRFRISFKREQPLSHEISPFFPLSIRRKHRTSFNLNDEFHIDLTEVTTENNNGSTQDDILSVTTYEVELEIVNPKINFKILNMVIGIILKTIQNTSFVYTEQRYFDIIAYHNKTLGSSLGKSVRVFDDKVHYKPRNLHYNDLIYGGLIGNPDEIYTVTWKTDGIRKILIFSPYGIWLIWPPYEAILIVNWNHPSLNGTILDGEYIPIERRLARNNRTGKRISIDEIISHRKDGISDSFDYVNQKYWFEVFDTLSYDGRIDIQHKPHSNRMKHAQKAINDLYQQPNLNKLFEVELRIATKTFKSFVTSTDFFSMMRNFDAKSKTLLYEMDGYMFTPENMPYNSNHDKTKLWNRVLTNVSDICKYKPPQDITNDFAIIWKLSDESNTVSSLSCTSPSSISPIFKQHNQNRELILMVGEGGRLIPFKGTLPFPFNNNMVDNQDEMIKDLPSGTIVEYRWCSDRKILIPLRTRPDKSKPNQKIFADDNWNLMRDPIQMSTLLGNNTTLLRKYHNTIKKGLFNGAISRSKTAQPNLLDIGTGRGGDVNKMKDYGRIIAVEPNDDHIYTYLIPRFKSRYSQEIIEVIDDSSIHNLDNIFREINRRNDHIVVIKTGGENSELIQMVVERFFPSQKADVVSMMLSMSFFWKSPEMLDALTQTISKNISPTGEFCFLTIDGDLVEESFNPKFGNGPSISFLEMGQSDGNGIKIQPDFKTRQVHIHIPDSIVTQQSEWLVRLDDLILRLNQHGFDIDYLTRADKEGLLTTSERIYTNMFTYGRFIPSHENNINGIVESTNSSIYQQIDSMDNTILIKVTAPTVLPLPNKETLEKFELNPMVPNINNENLDITKPDSSTQLISSSSVTLLSEENKILLSPTQLPSPITDISTISTESPKLSDSKMTGITPFQVKLPPPIVGSIPEMTIISPSQLPSLPKSPEQSFILPRSSPQLPITPRSPSRSPSRLPIVPGSPGQVRSPRSPHNVIKSPLIFSDSIPVPDPGRDLPPLEVDISPKNVYDVGRASGDDVSEIVTCKWYTEYPVVRIATIGDGSCFIHATLKSYLPSYANNPSLNNRLEMARNIRRDLAYTLQLPDSKHPGLNYYQSYQNGIFKTYHDKLGDSDVDYSIEGLQEIFNSTRYLGQEMYGYAGERLGINPIVVMAKTNNIVKMSGDDIRYSRHPKHIMITGNGAHYESIGIYKEGEGIQTVFNLDDSFLVAFYGNSLFDTARSSLNTIINKIRQYQDHIVSPMGVTDGEIFLNDDIVFQESKIDLENAKTEYDTISNMYEQTRSGTNRSILTNMFKHVKNIENLEHATSRRIDSV